MGGQSGGSTTVQKADPWSGVQPYLSALYSRTNDLMGQGGPQITQNSGVAGFTPYTQSVMGLINSFGSGATSGNANALSGVANAYAGTGSIPNQYLGNFIRGADPSQQVMANAMEGKDQTAQTYSNALSGRDATDNYYANVLGGGDPTVQYLKNVMGGGYLNGNPGLTNAMNAANSATTRQFNTAVMPQLASQFSLAGRYGSGAQSQGISDATNNLATQLSNTNAGIMNQNYQNERNLQTGAAGTLSGLQSGAAGAFGNYLLNNANAAGTYRQGAASNYLNSLLSGNQALSANQLAGGNMLNAANANDVQRLNMLGTLSDAAQQQAQSVLSGNNAVYNYNQQLPYQNLNWVNGILNGSMSLNGQTTNQSPNSSMFQRLGGGALSGGMMGGAIAGMSGGAIAGPVGMGVGALGGALLSVL